MKTTPNPTAEQVINVAMRLAARTLGHAVSGSPRADDLARYILRHGAAAGAAAEAGDDPTEEQIEAVLFHRWDTMSRCCACGEHFIGERAFARHALTAAAGVAPQEPSPVASTPTVSDDSGHGGDDDRGGREDGPEDEGRSHQATVAGTPQRPSGCAECHRSEGHKMDCSHRFAAQPMLDPEKVRLVIAHSVREGMKFGDLYRIADALCEAAKRGELNG